MDMTVGIGRTGYIGKLPIPLCTVGEFAAATDLSGQSIRRYIRAGELPAKRIGHRWFIRIDELLEEEQYQPKKPTDHDHVDRFGQKIHISDWVAVDRSCFRVLGFEESSHAKARGCAFAQLDDGRVFNTNVLTLCPLGADGKPLLIGETVYGKLSRDEYRVEGYKHDSLFGNTFVIVYDHVFDRKTVCPPYRLTHEAPDSWEKLRDDMDHSPSGYCNMRNLPYDNSSDKSIYKTATGMMNDDIIARAKRLAGAE